MGAQVSLPGASASTHRQLLHRVRDWWRLQRLKDWLASSRRDAMIARREGLRVDAHTIPALRKLYDKLSTHAKAVMLGGFKTEATVSAAEAVTKVCAHCAHGPPFLDHVLWMCPGIRRQWELRPQSNLAARLGWTWPLDLQLPALISRLEAMGAVRAQEAAIRCGPRGPHRRSSTLRTSRGQPG